MTARRDDRELVLGITPCGRPDGRLVVAICRGGGLGVLDVGLDVESARVELALVSARWSGQFGVKVPEPTVVDPAELPAQAATVIVADAAAVGRYLSATRRVLVEVTTSDEAELAIAAGAAGLVVKGAESGGRSGEETAFVLLQRLVRKTALPLWVQGGIGLHTAGAAIAGGARGVVIDAQLALARDCSLPAAQRQSIAAMDGSEPVGQDAAFAAPLAARYRTAGRIVQALRGAIAAHLRGAWESLPLGPGAGVAAVHGLRYPIAQGPMTRVSDRAAFASVVAEAGGLPFLALSLMRGEEITDLCDATRRQVGGRPWGAGIQAFAPAALREEQLAAVRAARPPLALIAGGSPAQAASLEAAGIATYLYVPSPGQLDGFLHDGARRFVFEGRESGGDVGPRSSFTLWEQQIERLLAAAPGVLADVEVLFAGGIHDARSAVMVATLAAPLVERGARIGVLMGTAYMATAEAVATGAISPTVQQVVLECHDTVLVETAPGRATRCAASQRSSGPFMIGQVAALQERPTSVARLHAHVSEGSSRLLAAARDDAVRTAMAEPFPGLDIAVVGTAGIFLGAGDVEQLWAHAVLGVDTAPAALDPDPRPSGGERTARPSGAEPTTLRNLHVAATALADAGCVDRERVALVLGAVAGAEVVDIAQRLGFGGASYAVDAAGGAALTALAAATKELVTDAADVVLCGADERAAGSGCVVLKRLGDAERDGDRILAVLDAVGRGDAGIGELITAVHAVHRGVVAPTLVLAEPGRGAVLSAYAGGDPPAHGFDLWPAELFVLRGPSAAEAAGERDHLARLLEETDAPLRDLAATMAERAAGHPIACAFVAESHDDLRAKLTGATGFVAASARGDAGGDDLLGLSNESSQASVLFPEQPDGALDVVFPGLAVADLLGRCGVRPEFYDVLGDGAGAPGLRRFLEALAELAVQPQVSVDMSPLFAGRTAVVDAPASVRSAASLKGTPVREREVALASLGAPMVGGAVQAANAAPPTVTQFGAVVEADSTADPDVAPIPRPLLRSVPQLVVLPPSEGGVSLAGVTVGVVGGGSNLVGPLCELLRGRGARPLEIAAHDTAFAEVGMLVDLTALRLGGDDPTAAVTGQFCRLRAAVGAGVPDIVVVTGLGGGLGLPGPGGVDPTTTVGAAAVGMVRTAAAELSDVRVRLVDLPVAGDPHLRARQIADELVAAAPPLVVGYTSRRRQTVEIVPRPREVDPSTGVHRNDLHLGPHTVLLVTGGARGPAVRCVLELARRYGCAFEIVGRTPLDAGGDAAEIRRTLDELSAHARSVRYHAVDIRDTAAFGALIDEMRLRHGRLDGVLHAAGIRDDEPFATKTVESFTRVFDTKVRAVDLLADAVDFGGFVVFLGGVSGVFGRPGQVDDAAASSVLDVVAHLRSGASRERRVLSVDWDLGAAVAASPADSDSDMDIDIDIDAGVTALVDELRHGAPDPQVVLTAEPHG